MRSSNSKNSKPQDWHRQDILAAVRKRGTSLAALARSNGLASTTLQNALDRHWPRGEQIIAEFIGELPSTIWPSRYQDPDSSIYAYKNDHPKNVA